jgi:hypothetical protein
MLGSMGRQPWSRVLAYWAGAQHAPFVPPCGGGLGWGERIPGPLVLPQLQNATPPRWAIGEAAAMTSGVDWPMNAAGRL